MNEIVASSSSGLVAEAMRDQAALAETAGETLRRQFENVSTASSRLTESLGRLPSIQDAYFMPSFELPVLDTPVIPVNPAFETNERLDDLIGHIAGLVDVATQQAKLTQAINESTQTALQLAIQSGKEAKAATKLARISVFVTLGALVVTIVGMA